MPLFYLALLIVTMFLGAMLIHENPSPLLYHVQLLGWGFDVQSSLLELICVSACVGACGMAVPYLKYRWEAARERRKLAHEADELRSDNRELRHDAEHARAQARLVEARLAEAEERYGRLAAEARPLLTMRQDAASDGEAPAAPPRPYKVASRWRRR